MANIYQTPTDQLGSWGPLLQMLLKGGVGAATGGFGSQSAGTLGLGALQAVPSLINLIKLSGEERPNYQIAPEQQNAYNLAEQRSKFGFMPQQIGDFNQNLAQTQNTDYYNARNMAGGGLAQALLGRLSGQRLGALNQFAAQDAQMQNQNVNALYGQAGRMQSQRNMATQQDINYRMAKEQAAGRGLSSGLTNIASGINSNQALGLGFGNSGLAQGANGGSGGQNMPNYSGAPTLNQPSYNPYGPENNPYGGQNLSPYNQTSTPGRSPFGGGLWNPYDYTMPSPSSPYKQPPMLSSGN